MCLVFCININHPPFMLIQIRMMFWLVDTNSLEIRFWMIVFGHTSYSLDFMLYFKWAIFTLIGLWLLHWHLKTHISYLDCWDDHHITKHDNLIWITCILSSYHWYYKYQLACTLWRVIGCSTNKDGYSWVIPYNLFHFYPFLPLTTKDCR